MFLQQMIDSFKFKEKQLGEFYKNRTTVVKTLSEDNKAKPALNRMATRNVIAS